jgi:hypothetical protein
VSSSNLASVGYDGTISVLEVEFHSGAVYQYFDVPEQHYTGLINAPSAGQYFNAHVKGHYAYMPV